MGNGEFGAQTENDFDSGAFWGARTALVIQYNTIQYKTCNAPYVTRMLFVGADLVEYVSQILHFPRTF